MQFYLKDAAFYNDLGSSKHQSPKKLQWNRIVPHPWDNSGLVFYTDEAIKLATFDDISKVDRVAWLLEPQDINQNSYDFIFNNSGLFCNVLSHNKEIVNKIPNAMWYPYGGTWINEDERKIYDKTRNISIIASNKTYTKGHQLRHFVINRYSKFVHPFGLMYNPIKNKTEGLSDFRFHITIENCSVDDYFTEKIVDAFLTGSIPIYWGSPSIGKHFDPRGFITFSGIEELDAIISNLAKNGEEIYAEAKDAITNNFEIAKSFVCAEDWFVEKYYS